jgi:hypothetical protein
MVIESRFPNPIRFSEGLAAVEVDGKFGYIDTTGQFVLPPRFRWAGSFTDSLASVSIGPEIKGFVGDRLIDRTGACVWPVGASLEPARRPLWKRIIRRRR